jgi:hypothetical protein
MDMRHNLPDGHPAYAETMAAVRKQQRAEEFLYPRVDELLTLLKNRSWSGARRLVDAGPWAPVGSPKQISVVEDLSHWVQGHCDPQSVLCNFLLGQEAEVFTRYAVARACHEAEQMGAA